MFKFINRILFGGTYKVAHIDSTTGKRKVFWCDTWQDAIEWVACACNDDRVTVTDTTGFVLAQRVNMNDIEYIEQGLFTSFLPVSKAGEVAFNQMAEYTDGTGKVLSIHKQSTIQQLRQAGYKVGKAKKPGKVTAEQADEMLRELGIE